jgi:hypothetical protein
VVWHEVSRWEGAPHGGIKEIGELAQRLRSII